MGIITKYVLNSIFEKKSRLILICMAIVFSSLMLVGCLGITDSATETLSARYIEKAEGWDIYICPKGINTIKKGEHNFSNIKSMMYQMVLPANLNGDITKNVTVYARDFSDINVEQLNSNLEKEEYNGGVCIVSNMFLESEHMNIKDEISCYINSKKYSFTIIAEAMTAGLFSDDDKDSYSIIVPYDYLTEELDCEGAYNMIFANVNQGVDAEQVVNEINQNSDDVQAGMLFEKEIVTTQINQIVTYFYIMLVLVLIICILIIYSSYKLLVSERMKSVGTLLSLGALKAKIYMIFCIESAIYGVMGGVIGSGLGILGLFLVNYLISPLRKYGEFQMPSIPWELFGIGVAFAIVTALISSFIPILKIGKIQIVDIILMRQSEKQHKSGFWKNVIGWWFLLASVGVNYFMPSIATEYSFICLILTLVGIIFVLPDVIKVISKLLYSVLKKRCSIFALACNNVGSVEILNSNIILLFITLFIVIAINSAGSSLTAIMEEAYSELNYDILISLNQNSYLTNGDRIKELLEEDEAIDASTIQELSMTSVTLDDGSIYLVGIDAEKYLDYDHYIDWDSETYVDVYQDFKNSSENSVILSEKAADMYKVKVGDRINLEYKDIEQEFLVAGIVNGKMEYNSVFCLAKAEIITEIFKDVYPSTIVCELKEGAAIEDDLIKSVAQYGGKVSTYEESIAASINSNKQILMLLNIFTIVAIVVSSFGILNNLTIGFIQRQGSFAVLGSLGLVAGQRVRLLIYETVYVIVSSIGVIFLSSKLLLNIVSKVTKGIGIELNINLNYKSLGVITAMTFVVMLISMIPILIRSKKFSIIEVIQKDR